MVNSIFRQAITAFTDKKIAVIGDLMLDVYEYGAVTRLSPEAPVPVVRMQARLAVPGGAANAARNARACGAQVALFGVLGADGSGAEVRALLHRDNIDVSGILTDGSRPTTEKKRIVGPDGHILRVDYESTDPIGAPLAAGIWTNFDAALASCAAVVIADYAKGVMSAGLAAQIITAAQARAIPVVVDTKPANASFYRGAAALTPNAREACEMSGCEDILLAGAALARQFGAPVIVTRGAEGMSLFWDQDPLHLAAIETVVADVSGAGDTVTAGVALGLAAGMALSDAMRLSNLMAALVVAKKGTAVVSAEELLRSQL